MQPPVATPEGSPPVSARVPVVINSAICGSPEFIKLFDGYRTLDQIQSGSTYSREELEDFVTTNIEQGFIAWKDQWSPLLWCDRCDLPLVSPQCDACGGRSERRIDLQFPCNPRSALPHDEAMFKAVGLPWPVDASILLNAYKHPDYWGWELVHRGKIVGDIIQRHEDSRFELVCGPDLDKSAFNARGVTMDDLVRANATRLRYLEQEAIAYINSFKQRFQLMVSNLQFSGGKDSVVLAHITSQTKLGNVHVYQINTGIEPEYNETFSNEFLASYKSFKVQKMFSRDMFWKSIRKLGPHALDFQWCRTILKNLAFYRKPKDLKTKTIHFLARFAKPHVLILNGARNREEPERVGLSRSLKLQGSHPTVPTAAVTTLLPLALFTDLDVWMYIHLRKLPINPAYTQDRGQRLVCMFCFEKNDHEFEIDVKAYPGVYARLEAELRHWQKKFNFPDEWITQRLWRYNESQSKYAKKLKILPRVDTVVDELEKAIRWGEETFANGEFRRSGKLVSDVSLSEMADWFKAFGKCSLNRDRLVVSADPVKLVAALGGDKSDRLSLTLQPDGSFEVVANDGELMKKFTRLVHGWALAKIHCIQCGGCVKQTNDIVISDERLTVRKALPLDTIEAIFKDCPVHPEGIKNIQRPLTREFSPTSCTSCFMKYKKDMALINPNPGEA